MNILVIIVEAIESIDLEVILGGIFLAIVVYFGGCAIMGWPMIGSEFLTDIADPEFEAWGEYILLAAAIIIPIILRSPAAFFVTIPAYALLYTFGDAIINGGDIVGGLFMGVFMGAALAIIPAAILSVFTD